MVRRWLTGFAVLALVTASVLARPGVVVTKDGRTIEGDITVKEDRVLIKVGAIETVVDSANVESMKYSVSAEEEYQERLGKLSPTDAKGRLELSSWAFAKRRYDLARRAANDALQLDPNSREAVEMLDTIRRQMLLESRPTRATTAEATETPSASETLPADVNLLTARDVQAIRRAELQLSDEGRVSFQMLNNVESRYARSPGVDTETFFALSSFARAIEILKKGDAQMRADVRLVTDPESLREYRGNIQRSVMAGCAATGCHTLAHTGSFRLVQNANNELGAYTNFYLLQQYARRGGSTDGGVFGPSGQQKMIDRTQPDQSLLLQYGLPRNRADSPHPQVAGFRPAFASKEDFRYRQIREWIANSLSLVEPRYDVSFKLPPPATTQPAGTQPTR